MGPYFHPKTWQSEEMDPHLVTMLRGADNGQCPSSEVLPWPCRLKVVSLVPPPPPPRPPVVSPWLGFSPSLMDTCSQSQLHCTCTERKVADAVYQQPGRRALPCLLMSVWNCITLSARGLHHLHNDIWHVTHSGSGPAFFLYFSFFCFFFLLLLPAHVHAVGSASS